MEAGPWRVKIKKRIDMRFEGPSFIKLKNPTTGKKLLKTCYIIPQAGFKLSTSRATGRDADHYTTLLLLNLIVYCNFHIKLNFACQDMQF